MKKQALFVGLLSIIGLTSCGGSSTSMDTTTSGDDSTLTTDASSESSVPSDSSSVVVPRSFEEMYTDLQGPMTIRGLLMYTLSSSTGEGEPEEFPHELEVKWGETSFHVEQTGDEFPIESTVYTDERNLALHYYINVNNEPESEVITDEETGEEVAWREYDNPFKYLDSSLFSVQGEGESRSIDLTDEAILNDVVYLVNNITYSSAFGKYVELGKNPYQEATLIVEGDYIVGMSLAMRIEDMGGIGEFKYDLTFDYSSETDHSYPLPDPLPSEEYHKTLRTALFELETEKYSVSESYFFDYAPDEVWEMYACIDDDLIFINDEAYGEFECYIQKEDGVHEVIYHEGADLYGYKESVVVGYEQDGDEFIEVPVTDIKTMSPYVAIAAEWFSYDETTKVYSISGSVAGIIGITISPFALVDPFIEACTQLDITLDESNKISTMHFTGGENDYTLTYDFVSEFVMPFDYTTLEIMDYRAQYNGTYTTTINEVATTIVVTSDGVTMNGVTCTDVKLDEWSGESLQFTCDGVKYQIGPDFAELLCMSTYATYPLEKIA